MSQTDDPMTYAVYLHDPEGMQLMDAAAFTQVFAERVRVEKPDAAVAIADDLELEVKEDSGVKRKLRLDNVYKGYLNSPQDLDDLVARYLRSMLASPEDWDSQMNDESLLPVLRSRAFLEEMSQAMMQPPEDAEAARPVSDRINDEISVLYVFDTEHSMRYMQARDFEELSTDRDGLFGRAVANLRKVLHNPEVEGDEDCYMPVAGGDYESSLLFLSEFWTKERFPVKGEIVVFPLARDVLIVTGSEERKGLAKATKMAAKAEATMDHFISDKPFRYKDGRWVRFTLPKRGWWPFGR